MEEFELSEEARVDILSSLDQQETELNNLLKAHNESKSFSKKETYEVQGFKIKGITLRHAHNKIRKILINAGFHPSITANDLRTWREKLIEKTETNETQDRQEGSE